MIHSSRRSCSGPAAAISSTSAAGTRTAPSPSATTRSPGNTATPPQPIGSCQPTKVRPRHRRRRGDALTPHREPGGPYAVAIAHHAVGHQPGDAALADPRAQNVAEDTGVGTAPRTRHRHASRRHRLDRGPRGGGRTPRLRGGQILTRRHEAQREGASHHARLAGLQRPRAAHPYVAQPFLSSSVVRVAVVTPARAAMTSWSIGAVSLCVIGISRVVPRRV